MRPLTLHVSALNDDEYDLFTSSFADLAASDTSPIDDAQFEKLSVSIREARAWLRGRYADFPVADLDEILQFFAPKPGHEPIITGGQFFAILRLVLHVRGGAELDRNLVFAQVHPKAPKNDFLSPTKTHHDSSPRHISSTRARQPSGGTIFDAPTSDTNPFTNHSHASVDLVQQPPLHPDLRQGSVSSPTIVPIKPPHHASNPFVTRSKTIHSTTSMRSAPPPLSGPLTSKSDPSPPPAERKVPPLPPRKPPPVLPPRNASLLLANPGTTHAKPPPPPIAPKVPHLTTALMKQSLQASKAAQDAKRAEELREQTRFLQVLKSSNAHGLRIDSGMSSSTSSSSDDRTAGPPPMPPRRILSPPPSTTSAVSARSFEQVASARLPTRLVSRSKSPLGRSPSTSPSRPTTDLPPPLHPDRKTPLAGDSSAQSSPSSPRVGRSKSMHYVTPPPVPPPLRRRRPESVQLPSSSTSAPSHLFAHQPATATTPGSFPRLSRHTSMSQRDPRERPWDRDDLSEPSPVAHFQKTLSGLGPKIDAARYKAEAGLSKRGYGRWGEERLVVSASSSEEGLGMDGELTDGERSGVERDDMKWPVGEREGWKPLA
ncbi:hypothetical protein BV25DRAFT_1902095 [Artomyces pyxidatus]|uniref:Uncharacterized protein n=1 Tax=Artomyces pyxidatus TaxID=48021 RepID=A0ACB8SS41_9AGAM|nr:hypothetical protein BV25DRAFT_1902095 [Artomyces pyxidatus]